MPSMQLSRLPTVLIRVFVAVLATVSGVLIVWYGGLTVLSVLGVADPTRGKTGTILGVSAVAIGTSLFPSWLTLRDYFAPEVAECIETVHTDDAVEES